MSFNVLPSLSALFGSSLDLARLTALLTLIAILAIGAAAGLRDRTTAPGRRLEGFDQQGRIVSESREESGWLHLSAGSSSLASADSASTLAGLFGLSTAMDSGRGSASRSLLTTGDSTIYFLADALMPVQSELIALDPAAYVAALGDLIADRKPHGNLMLGALDDTYLLPAMAARAHSVNQVIGSTSIAGMPLLHAHPAEAPLLGEEVLIAGSLDSAGSSAAHAADRVRGAVIVAILAILLTRYLGLL